LLWPAATTLNSGSGGHDGTESQATKSHAATSSGQRVASSSQGAKCFDKPKFICFAVAHPDATKRDASVISNTLALCAANAPSHSSDLRKRNSKPRGLENTRSDTPEHHNPEAPSSAAHPVGRERDLAGRQDKPGDRERAKWPGSETPQFATPHQISSAANASGHGPEPRKVTEWPPLRTTQTTTCQVAIIKEKPCATGYPIH